MQSKHLEIREKGSKHVNFTALQGVTYRGTPTHHAKVCDDIPRSKHQINVRVDTCTLVSTSTKILLCEKLVWLKEGIAKKGTWSDG